LSFRNGCDHEVLEHFDVGRIHRGGIDSDGPYRPLSIYRHVYETSTAGDSHGLLFQFLLDFSEPGLHLLAKLKKLLKLILFIHDAVTP